MSLCSPPMIRAEELRDPFVFGPRTGEATAQTGPTLVGVLWDATHPLAIIGDETVKVGDPIAEWRVVEIKADSVTIERGERRVVLHPGDGLPRD